MSQSSRKFLGYVVIGSLVFGLVLMALSLGVDGLFLTGLGMFSVGLVISIVWGMWNSAGWMDKQTRKYFD